MNTLSALAERSHPLQNLPILGHHRFETDVRSTRSDNLSMRVQ